MNSIEFISKRIANIMIFLGKGIFIFGAGSIIFHMIVMVIDYFLMIKPLELNLHENFPGSMFSIPMIPMLVAYGLLSLVIFYLWEKNRKAVLLSREKELKSENLEIVLKSMQRLTGLVAEHIASQNSEIMNWIELRKKKGRPVSKKVETSNKNIANALQSLSELSFVSPYTKNRPRNIIDFEVTLQNKLRSVSR
jgi:hypothetical protein